MNKKIEEIIAIFLVLLVWVMIITIIGAGCLFIYETIQEIDEEGKICENNCIELGFEPYELDGGMFSATVCKCKDNSLIKRIW